ncbi:Site-specific recombinase XerD [Cellulosimicrobium cellulans]|nr:Site-specific recombinase XerD [Cellulosimicrobium cellulans]
MKAAGAPATSPRPAPRTQRRETGPAAGGSTNASEDPFGEFLRDAASQRERDAKRRTEDDRPGIVDAPDGWVNPDPRAILALSPGRHPVDLMLARCKEGELRRAAEGKLRICAELIIGAHPGALTREDLRSFAWHHLTVDVATEFMHSVARRYRPQASRNDMVSLVRRVVQQCYRQRLIDALRRDLLLERLFTVAVGESTKRRRLSTQEITALMAACESIGSTRTAARNTAIVALFRTSGLRIGELVKIRLEDWDRQQGTILLRETKNGQDHLVFLHETTTEYLERWLGHRGDGPGPLFSSLISAEIRPVTPTSLRYMLRTRAEAAGVAPFGSHDFRRTFATDLLETVDPALVSRLLNHRKLESTMIYDQRGDDAKRDAVRHLALPGLETLAATRADEPAFAAAGLDVA